MQTRYARSHPQAKVGRVKIPPGVAGIPIGNYIFDLKKAAQIQTESASWEMMREGPYSSTTRATAPPRFRNSKMALVTLRPTDTLTARA